MIDKVSIPFLFVDHVQRVLINFKEFIYRFNRNKGSVLGFCLLLIIFFFAWGTPIFINVEPFRMVTSPFLPPSSQYIMGTDDLGRNVFHMNILGAQTSLMVGAFAATISTLLGLFIGSLSGYYGGKIDVILMRTTEFFMVIPAFFLALIVVAVMGASIWNIILTLGILIWPRTARLVRGEFLRLKNRQFVDAARAIGNNDRTIIFSEILPNALPPVIVNMALEVGTAITFEAGISFLGLGDPEQMSWGVILYQAQLFILRAPWISFFAGFGIFLTVLSLNLMADGLNEALNPRLNRIIK